MPWLPLFFTAGSYLQVFFSQLLHTKNTFAISTVFRTEYGRFHNHILVQFLSRRVEPNNFHPAKAAGSTALKKWSTDLSAESWPWLKHLRQPGPERCLGTQRKLGALEPVEKAQKVGELNFVFPSPHKTLCYLLSLSLSLSGGDQNWCKCVYLYVFCVYIMGVGVI